MGDFQTDGMKVRGSNREAFAVWKFAANMFLRSHITRWLEEPSQDGGFTKINQSNTRMDYFETVET